ncbi:MAG: hypothetical protein V5A64_04470, partial [Candidatus Thermoplasmatota archaeon]
TAFVMVAAAFVAGVSATTVTNNNAPAATEQVGATNVLVMNFTITATQDYLMDGDGDTTYGNGTVDANVGAPLTDFVDSDNLCYYRNSTTDQFVLWHDDGTNRWYNSTEDTLLHNMTGSSYGADIDNTSGENITGTVYNSTQLLGPVGAQGYLRYADGTDGLDGNDYQVGDDIFFEMDNNSCYLDELNAVTFQNTGTADTNDIASVTLWSEDGSTPGFQPTEDGQLPQASSANATWYGANNYWYFSGLTFAIGAGSSLSRTFYVAVNYTSDASNYDVKMKIPTLSDANSNGTYDAGDEGLFLASTDDTGNFVNSNTQTIGKLGVTYYEGNQTGPANIITNNHDNMYYGNTVDIRVDTSMLESTGNYYLYRPKYIRSGSIPGAYTYNLKWETVTAGGSAVYINSDQSSVKTFSGISLDSAGRWLIDDGTPSDANGTEGDNDFAHFWVNNTSPYSIEISNDEIYYGNNETITITVTEEGSSAPTWIDVRDDSDTLVKHSWEPDGTITLKGDWNNFSAAGNYTVSAYYDVDETSIGYGSYGYSDVYGYSEPSDLINTATNYSYLCGPWDPYEKNATSKTILVKPGVPTTTVQAGNDTMYWGFDGEVNITVKGYDGENLQNALSVKVYNEQGAEITNNVTVNEYTTNGYIHISDTTWGSDTSVYGGNGTYYAYIYNNTNGDSGGKQYTQEWNTTVEWSVTSAPDAQWKWIDDDGSVSEDDNDDVIPKIPTDANVPIDIQFQILGSTNTDYFGDTSGSGSCSSTLECKENITISGDTLFTGSLDKIPGIDYGSTRANTWTVPIIPTMSSGGGTITFTVNAFNTTLTKNINIGGGKYSQNGSVVTVTPNEFAIDQEDRTLSISVKDASTGTDITAYSNIYLYYIGEGGAEGDPIESHAIDHVTSSTMTFNTTQQTTNQTEAGFSAIKAPRNLTIYVNGPGNRNGYARIKMNAVSDLEVDISRTTFMAGKRYNDLEINCTIAGNSTATPNSDDKGDFYIKIYDEDDNDVTDTLFHGISAGDLTDDGDYKFGDGSDNDFDDVWAVEPGTYTLYAYNNTHNSIGYNATITVKSVGVSCNKDPFIWKADKNITTTFTVTYEGEPLNGTLVVDNISDVEASDYNITWANTSFTPEGTSGTGGSDAAGNDSLALEVTDGVAVINDLTASYLNSGVTSQTHTFYFRPDKTSGEKSAYAIAGEITIRVPTVSVNPANIPVGKTTPVTVTTYGRDTTKVGGVYIKLHGQGVNLNGNTSKTGTDKGQVLFSVLPTSSGNISIDVGEAGRTLDDTVIKVVDWQLSISTPTTVDEGKTFTVTVNDATGSPVSGATVTVVGVTHKTTDSNGEATFTAPEVSSTRSYDIRASHPEYDNDPNQPYTIYVENIPELVVAVDSDVYTNQEFEIVVGKDGDAVIGASVTFNGETKQTKSGGVATFKAPSEAKDYNITVTFGDLEPVSTTVTVEKKSEPTTDDVPGFELLTLVAAIGVALILLRRRQNK